MTPAPPSSDSSIAHLRHSTALRLTLPLLKGLAWLTFACCGAPMRAWNRRRVPKRGGLLVFANHISNTDPVLVQWACPRPVNFMSRRDMFEMKVIGPLIKWFRAFPVTQSSADKQALRTAIALLEAGQAVMMFPEGKLSESGNLQPIMPGATLLVRKTGVPCICLGITGTDKVMPFAKTSLRWAGGTTLQARWGEPKAFGKDARPEEILEWIESELRTLSDQPAAALSPES